MSRAPPVSPQLPAIPPRDGLEHPSLGITDARMAGVDALDQLVVGLLVAVVHPDLTWGYGGGGTLIVSNTCSKVKGLDRALIQAVFQDPPSCSMRTVSTRVRRRQEPVPQARMRLQA